MNDITKKRKRVPKVLPRKKAKVSKESIYLKRTRELLEIPPAFICPVSKEIMKTPVITADGHSYDKSSIERWLQMHNTSPITNKQLDHPTLIENIVLRTQITDYKETIVPKIVQHVKKCLSKNIFEDVDKLLAHAKECQPKNVEIIKQEIEYYDKINNEAKKAQSERDLLVQLLEDGKAEEAISLFRQFVGRCNTNEEKMQMLDMIIKSNIYNKQNADPNALMEIVHFHVNVVKQNKQLDEAIKILNTCEKILNKNVDYFKLKLELLKEHKASNHELCLTCCKIGDLLVERDELKEAMEWYEKAKKYDEQTIEVFEGKLKVFEKNKNEKMCNEMQKQIAKLYEDREELEKAEMYYQLASNTSKVAKKALARILKQQNKNTRAEFVLASLNIDELVGEKKITPQEAALHKFYFEKLEKSLELQKELDSIRNEMSQMRELFLSEKEAKLVENIKKATTASKNLKTRQQISNFVWYPKILGLKWRVEMARSEIESQWKACRVFLKDEEIIRDFEISAKVSLQLNGHQPQEFTGRFTNEYTHEGIEMFCQKECLNTIFEQNASDDSWTILTISIKILGMKKKPKISPEDIYAFPYDRFGQDTDESTEVYNREGSEDSDFSDDDDDDDDEEFEYDSDDY